MTKPWRSESSNSVRHSSCVVDAAGRIVRRAHVERVACAPRPRRRRRAIAARKPFRCKAVDAVRRCSREQRRAFVDLIERIGNDHRRADAARDRRPSGQTRTMPPGCRAPATPATTDPAPGGDDAATAMPRSPRAVRVLQPLWDNLQGLDAAGEQRRRMNCWRRMLWARRSTG